MPFFPRICMRVCDKHTHTLYSGMYPLQVSGVQFVPVPSAAPTIIMQPGMPYIVPQVSHEREPLHKYGSKLEPWERYPLHKYGSTVGSSLGEVSTS